MSVAPKTPDRAFGVQARRKDLAVGCPAGVGNVASEICGNPLCLSGGWVQDTHLPIPGSGIESGRQEDLSIRVDSVRSQWNVAHSHFTANRNLLFVPVSEVYADQAHR